MSPLRHGADASALAEQLAQRCTKASPTGDGWEACCPAHDDDNPSLSITPSTDKILLHCHAGCETEAIVAALGLTMADLFIRQPTSGRKRSGKVFGPIDKVYDYYDAHGTLLFQTVRYRAPKDFRQRRPDPAKPGAYLWNLTGIEPVLYHLPEVLAAVQCGETIYCAEGEKDVDALMALGLVATCNPLGADKWRRSYTQSLTGATVVIVPDHDAPGRKHAELVARSLYGIAASVKIVPLPGLPEKGDVSDWLLAEGTRPELERLATTAPLWKPAAAQADPTSPNPDASADDCAGPYQTTPTGLVWWKKNTDGQVAVPLTNFTARIVADVVEDDGVETRRYFELKACHEGRTICFSVEASHFAGLTWALEHLGARAAVYPGNLVKEHARMAIQLFSQDIRARRIYTHLGWRKINETWCYLHAGGAIGPDGPVSAVEVNARHTLEAYVLPGVTTREAHGAALRASLQLLTTADEAVTIPLYAALWRAVLGQADFSLHLVGPTGAGKSELAALAQQHYGSDMTARHLPAAWTSTGNALEGLAFEAKDVLLVVDDFCPSGSQADIQRFHKDADRLLRAQGNHSGRQRMNRDGTLRAVKPPRGLIVSTGEDTPQGQSLRARILILDVAPGSVQWPALTTCQRDAADETYATALAGFVQWLAPHYENISHGLPAEITALRQAALTSGHRRTPELVGNLALGMQYLLAYGHDIGALTLEECEALWQRTWTALVKAAEAQGEHQANEEPVRRFLALLTGALAAGLAHIADAHTLNAPSQTPEQWGWRVKEYGEGENTKVSKQPLGTCVGWLANTRLYLEGEAAFSVVQKLAESQRAPFAITQHTLWKRMHEQGLLVRDHSQEKNKVHRTIGSARRYVIDMSASLVSPVPLETGTSGTSGTNGAQPQQNQGKTPYLFPVWRTENRYTTEMESVHDTSAVPASLRGEQAPAVLCTDSGRGAVPISFPESVRKNGPQPQQHQGGVPKVPKVPKVAAYIRQTLSDDARGTPADGGDYDEGVI